MECLDCRAPGPSASLAGPWLPAIAGRANEKRGKVDIAASGLPPSPAATPAAGMPLLLRRTLCRILASTVEARRTARLNRLPSCRKPGGGQVGGRAGGQACLAAAETVKPCLPGPAQPQVCRARAIPRLTLLCPSHSASWGHSVPGSPQASNRT